MYLHELLRYVKEPLPEVRLNGLKLDSRKITAGDAFVAIPGHEVDGRNFISAAIAAGASVVLAHSDEFAVGYHNEVPIVYLPNLALRVSDLAGRFYGTPSKQLRLTGITGTNGKTTVSHLLAQLWQQLEAPAAVIGTVGSGLMQQLLPESLTTPDPITIQQRLAAFVAEGARSVTMEVSSHALTQGRVEGLHFNTLIATNVSRDHLDYHGTLKAYAAAKQRLFTDFPAAIRVLNADDKIISTWGAVDDYWFSMNPHRLGQPHTLVASDWVFHADHTRMTLNWEHESIRVESPLLGEFNIANVLAAVTAVIATGYSLADVAQYIECLEAVPGRMETFKGGQGPLVIVDYAHTPDALQQVLSAAQNHCTGRLWCVFGCGGDRDRGKRPQMGQIAAKYADVSIVTDDNPRTEDPQQIIDDIITGMPRGTEYQPYPDRAKAIRYALTTASEQDVVVCAGKGHETYQIIGSRRYDYDERAYVAAVTAELAELANKGEQGKKVNNKEQRHD